jgi:ketosteroid isomerase-like protein
MMAEATSDPALRALLDRAAIEDTLYRYASCIDRRDLAGIRAVLADDLWAQYGNADPVIGADTVVGFIDEYTKECIWQHHLLSVYHVDIDGDTASALVYHTSHQLYHTDPGAVQQIIARYHNQLRREADRWKISRLVFERLWAERRTDATDFHAEIGGRGPLMDDDLHRRDASVA